MSTETNSRTVADPVALDLIQKLLSRQEWSSSTMDEVAYIVRSTGREIPDINEDDSDG